MIYLGDYPTTGTVYIPLNTFTSDDPSASVTVTDLVAGDVKIHKNGSTTQRSSSAGITVSIDFDSITGNHLIAIDLTDNTDAGFYAAGSRYLVRVEGITVDGATINAWIAAFSIGVLATASDIVDAIMGDTIESTYTFAQLVRLITAAVVNDTEDSGLSFRDIADSKDRFTVVITDSSRNVTIVDAD